MNLDYWGWTTLTCCGRDSWCRRTRTWHGAGWTSRRTWCCARWSRRSASWRSSNPSSRTYGEAEAPPAPSLTQTLRAENISDRETENISRCRCENISRRKNISNENLCVTATSPGDRLSNTDCRCYGRRDWPTGSRRAPATTGARSAQAATREEQEGTGSSSHTARSGLSCLHWSYGCLGTSVTAEISVEKILQISSQIWSPDWLSQILKIFQTENKYFTAKYFITFSKNTIL